MTSSSPAVPRPYLGGTIVIKNGSAENGNHRLREALNRMGDPVLPRDNAGFDGFGSQIVDGVSCGCSAGER